MVNEGNRRKGGKLNEGRKGWKEEKSKENVSKERRNEE